jgi:hypothetical protein
MEADVQTIYTKSPKMKIYLKTLIKDIGRRETGRIASMVFTWCKQNMGVNNRKGYKPMFYLSAMIDDGQICGDYDEIDNEICIYYKNLIDVRELVDTMIHEWTHQLQPCRTKYNKFKGSYKKHPFEVEAYASEKIYNSKCWNDIKSKVNRS